MTSMRHGFLLIDKPRGPTSHDIVAMVRRELHERSIGHLGTLDPMADGLLVLAVGAKALKVVELFGKAEKEYEAEVRLGQVSSTYDKEGTVSSVDLKPGWVPPDDASKIRVVIEQRFLGRIKQVPPDFSAVSIGGERAYRKARRGEGIDMPERDVDVLACDILSYQYPSITLRIRCSSGTYIRSIANDLGQALGCGGYLHALRRTKVGTWSVDDSVRAANVAWTDVIPLKDILVDLPGLELQSSQWDELRFGRSFQGDMPDASPCLIAWHDGLPVALVEKDPKQSGMLKPRKVL